LKEKLDSLRGNDDDSDAGDQLTRTDTRTPGSVNINVGCAGSVSSLPRNWRI